MRLTIEEVIKQITRPVEPVANTVDTLKFGSPSTEVSGIAVSFMPSQATLEKTIELGANLLITHEGLFYSHWDQTELGENKVYTEKYELITHSGIAIFRFHDYFHRYKPDGIMVGLIQSLEWERYVEEHQPAASIVVIPTMTGKEIAEFVKSRLGIPFVRFVGDLETSCTRIGLLAGYRGGGPNVIPLMEKQNLDLVIYGEGPEWEAPEYVKDSIAQGKDKSLIILGHAESEDPGMRYLAEKLKKMFPETPVHFIPNEPVFKVI